MLEAFSMVETKTWLVVVGGVDRRVVMRVGGLVQPLRS